MSWWDTDEMMAYLKSNYPIEFKVESYERIKYERQPNGDSKPVADGITEEIVYHNKKLKLKIRMYYCQFDESVPPPYLPGTERGFYSFGYNAGTYGCGLICRSFDDFEIYLMECLMKYDLWNPNEAVQQSLF